MWQIASPPNCRAACKNVSVWHAPLRGLKSSFLTNTTGLDPIVSGVINDLIREIVVDMGATAMTITHDMTSVRTIADDIAMLHTDAFNGQVQLATWINLAIPISINSSTTRRG